MSARETSVAMGGAEWGMLLALTLLWSATFPFAKIALAELPPLTLVLVRIALAALALNMVVLAPAGAWRSSASGSPRSMEGRSPRSVRHGDQHGRQASRLAPHRGLRE